MHLDYACITAPALKDGLRRSNAKAKHRIYSPPIRKYPYVCLFTAPCVLYFSGYYMYRAALYSATAVHTCQTMPGPACATSTRTFTMEPSQRSPARAPASLQMPAPAHPSHSCASSWEALHSCLDGAVQSVARKACPSFDTTTRSQCTCTAVPS
jgi:hypothetical protein